VHLETGRQRRSRQPEQTHPQVNLNATRQLKAPLISVCHSSVFPPAYRNSTRFNRASLFNIGYNWAMCDAWRGSSESCKVALILEINDRWIIPSLCSGMVFMESMTGFGEQP
jgi:hypothetical protein